MWIILRYFFAWAAQREEVTFFQPVITFCLFDAVIMKSSVVAVDLAVVAVGPWAGTATAMLVALSVLGSANGIALVGGRYLVSLRLICFLIPEAGTHGLK